VSRTRRAGCPAWLAVALALPTVVTGPMVFTGVPVPNSVFVLAT
jgi:hypothetical protein